tara:strand:+ start:1072 stop:1299 length:228 start_codon:yes stop_codon:yes gene_type:complete
MTKETYETITFFQIEKGDVIQMKQPGKARFSNRIAIATSWNHDVVGRVFEDLRPTGKIIAESTDSKNQFRRIHIK